MEASADVNPPQITDAFSSKHWHKPCAWWVGCHNWDQLRRNAGWTDKEKQKKIYIVHSFPKQIPNSLRLKKDFYPKKSFLILQFPIQLSSMIYPVELIVSSEELNTLFENTNIKIWTLGYLVQFPSKQRKYTYKKPKMLVNTWHI